MSVATLSETRTYNRVLELSLDKILPGIKENAFDHKPLLSILAGKLNTSMFGQNAMQARGKKVLNGGTTIEKKLNLGKNTNVKTLSSNYDTVDTTPNDSVRHGRASWKEYVGAITVPKFETLANQSPEAIASILETEATLTVGSLADFLGGHIYDNAGVGSRVTSISTLINANNSVQGLDGGTYTRWNSRGKSARGTVPASISFASGSFAAQGIQDMRLAWLNAEEGTMKPHAVFTTHTVFSYYEGSLQPQERFMDSRTADGGFVQLRFKEAPIFADPDCGSGLMYFLNFDNLYLSVMSGADFTRGDFIEDSESMVSVSKVYLVCQMFIENRFAGNNKLTSITA